MWDKKDLFFPPEIQRVQKVEGHFGDLKSKRQLYLLPVCVLNDSIAAVLQFRLDLFFSPFT